jgi:hypothetical protein
MLSGLRADGRRAGLGLCGNSWARCDDLAVISTIAKIAPPRRAVAPPMRYFGWAQAQSAGRRGTHPRPTRAAETIGGHV